VAPFFLEHSVQIDLTNSSLFSISSVILHLREVRTNSCAEEPLNCAELGRVELFFLKALATTGYCSRLLTVVDLEARYPES